MATATFECPTAGGGGAGSWSGELEACGRCLWPRGSRVLGPTRPSNPSGRGAQYRTRVLACPSCFLLPQDCHRTRPRFVKDAPEGLGHAFGAGGAPADFENAV